MSALHRTLSALAFVAVAAAACATPAGLNEEDGSDGRAEAGELPGDERAVVGEELAAFAAEACAVIAPAFEPLFDRAAAQQDAIDEALDEAGLPDFDEATQEDYDAILAIYEQVLAEEEQGNAQAYLEMAATLPGQLRQLDDPPSVPGAVEQLARSLEVPVLLSDEHDLPGIDPLRDGEVDADGLPAVGFDRLSDPTLVVALNGAGDCADVREAHLDGAPLFAAAQDVPDGG